jgi:hypothetical protein
MEQYRVYIDSKKPELKVEFASSNNLNLDIDPINPQNDKIIFGHEMYVVKYRGQLMDDIKADFFADYLTFISKQEYKHDEASNFFCLEPNSLPDAEKALEDIRDFCCKFDVEIKQYFETSEIKKDEKRNILAYFHGVAYGLEANPKETKWQIIFRLFF